MATTKIARQQLPLPFELTDINGLSAALSTMPKFTEYDLTSQVNGSRISFKLPAEITLDTKIAVYYAGLRFVKDVNYNIQEISDGSCMLNVTYDQPLVSSNNRRLVIVFGDDMPTNGNGSGTADLTNYYNKTDIDNKIDIINDNVSSISNELSTDYYNKAEVDNLISGVSGNDLTNYYNKTDIDGKILTLGNTDSSLLEKFDEYYNKTQVDDAIAAIQIPNFSDYYTATETDAAISTAINGIPSVDLTNYYNKEEVGTEIDTKIAAIAATDLSNYYTIEQVDNLVTNITGTDLTAYSTTEQMNTAISDAVTGIGISDYAKTTDITTTLNGYYTKTEVNGLIPTVTDFITTEALNTALSGYALIASIPNVTGFVDSTAVDTAISNAIAAIPPVDLSNYFTKQETLDESVTSAQVLLSSYSDTATMNTAINTAITTTLKFRYNTATTKFEVSTNGGTNYTEVEDYTPAP